MPWVTKNRETIHIPKSSFALFNAEGWQLDSDRDGIPDDEYVLYYTPTTMVPQCATAIVYDKGLSKYPARPTNERGVVVHWFGPTSPPEIKTYDQWTDTSVWPSEVRFGDAVLKARG